MSTLRGRHQWSWSAGWTSGHSVCSWAYLKNSEEEGCVVQHWIGPRFIQSLFTVRLFAVVLTSLFTPPAFFISSEDGHAGSDCVLHNTVVSWSSSDTHLCLCTSTRTTSHYLFISGEKMAQWHMIGSCHGNMMGRGTWHLYMAGSWAHPSHNTDWLSFSPLLPEEQTSFIMPCSNTVSLMTPAVEITVGSQSHEPITWEKDRI